MQDPLKPSTKSGILAPYTTYYAKLLSESKEELTRLKAEGNPQGYEAYGLSEQQAVALVRQAHAKVVQKLVPLKIEIKASLRKRLRRFLSARGLKVKSWLSEVIEEKLAEEM